MSAAYEIMKMMIVYLSRVLKHFSSSEVDNAACVEDSTTKMATDDTADEDVTDFLMFCDASEEAASETPVVVVEREPDGHEDAALDEKGQHTPSSDVVQYEPRSFNT